MLFRPFLETARPDRFAVSLFLGNNAPVLKQLQQHVLFRGVEPAHGADVIKIAFDRFSVNLIDHIRRQIMEPVINENWISQEPLKSFGLKEMLASVASFTSSFFNIHILAYRDGRTFPLMIMAQTPIGDFLTRQLSKRGQRLSDSL
jgi:hypothetical protein